MFPVLVKIGPITVHTYGFLIAVGFLVALFLANQEARKKNISGENITDLAFYVLAAAIVGSRLFFVLTNVQFFRHHPMDVVKIWEGGLVFYGGLLAAVPTAIWYVRRKGLPVWQTADIFAPSTAVGHAIGRLGCFCAGCCYGKPAEGLPWAVIFRDPSSLAVLNVPLHPSQLYESAAEFMNFLILITLRKWQSFNGQLFWMYILNYSVIRYVVELYRGDISRGFILPGAVSISQGISGVMCITALVMMLRLRKQRV